MMDVGDWAGLVGAFAALGGLAFVGLQVADQARAAELNSATVILSELGRRWSDYLRSKTNAGATDQEIEFTFGEVANYYEALCFLINNRIVSRRVSGLIAPGVIDALQRLANDGDLRARLTRLAKGGAFSEMRRFVDERASAFATAPSVNDMLRADS